MADDGWVVFLRELYGSYITNGEGDDNYPVWILVFVMPTKGLTTASLWCWLVYIVKDLLVFSEVWASLVPFVGMKEGSALEMWLRELESLKLWVVFLDVGLTIFEWVLVDCNIGFVACLKGKSWLGFYQIGMLHHAIQARKSSKVPSILKCTMIHAIWELLHLIW